jgi:signal transduction histidine kinase
VVAAVLRAEAAELQRRLRRDPSTPLPSGPWLSAFRADATEAERWPPEVVGLPPGVHEVRLSGRKGIHAAVFEIEGRRFVLLVELGAIEALERYLGLVMLVMVVAGAALSGLLAWWLAGHALRPLRRLAAAVEALPPQPQSTRLGTGLAADELGRLARAIDRYQARLLARENSDRAFFADASHELRTPLAVVRGASELLGDQIDPATSAGRALARLSRGIEDLEQRLQAVLLVARGVARTPAVVDLRRMAEAIPAAVAARASARGVRLEASAEALPVAIRAPSEALETLLRGILLALVEHGECGVITLARDGDALLFRSGSDAPLAASAPEESDRGPALALQARLAQELGWTLEAGPRTEGFEVRLRWPAEAIPGPSAG